MYWTRFWSIGYLAVPLHYTQFIKVLLTLSTQTGASFIIITHMFGVPHHIKYKWTLGVNINIWTQKPSMFYWLIFECWKYVVVFSSNQSWGFSSICVSFNKISASVHQQCSLYEMLMDRLGQCLIILHPFLDLHGSICFLSWKRGSLSHRLGWYLQQTR